jgi:hypothetical protein
MRAGRARRWALTALVAALVLMPGAAVGAECEGDECQAPPAAPDDQAPATAVVQGPPNPPVRFPKPRKPHKRKHHRQAGQGQGR